MVSKRRLARLVSLKYEKQFWPAKLNKYLTLRGYEDSVTAFQLKRNQTAWTGCKGEILPSESNQIMMGYFHFIILCAAEKKMITIMGC